ncbi:MAG: rod shape-determining protein RodA [Ignavibacteriales bacterium]|nr:rod shape-determining protein RodA [Ignavibacteriales bacterium]HPO55798.1 rod shape-determining protein RodA [Ignavibacteriaceae bacterium]
MRIDYKLNDKFDLSLFSAALILIVMGLMGIYSSTQNTPHVMLNFEKQLFSLGVGMAGLIIIYFLPLNFFKVISLPTYAVSIFLLVVVLLIGKTVGGAKSWIGLGIFSFQPVELAKFASVLALAHYLSKPNINLDNLKDIFITLAIGLGPVPLILLEPDMGSSFVFFGFVLIILFWRGLSVFGIYVVISPVIIAISSLLGTWYFVGGAIIVLALLFYFKKDLFTSGAIMGLNLSTGFFVDYLYNFLSPHQQKRIASFIDPMSDPLGAGYNSIQAQVAIGSGGLFGKGFLNGNQTQLQYIPEQWTDFIFCVIGEEFGFIGSVLLVFLFIVLFTRILKTAVVAKDDFFGIVLVGIFSIYFIHFIINIGMTIGILPIIGIPLPFVSYGGSSLLINLAMLGLVLNVYKSRII